MTQINVTKRSGKVEPLNIEKWQSQIAKVCDGIANVSQSMIEINSQPHFYNGMTTREIDEITLRAIVDLIDVNNNPTVGHVNYQYVGGKQRLSMLRKDVYGKYKPDRLYNIVVKNINLGLYTHELLEWYTEQEFDQMDEFVDHSKDEEYTYAAIEQLAEKYLIKNRATKTIYETPQVRYVIAAATVMHREPVAERMRLVKEYYAAASDGLFTLATPVLAGLGTPTKQFSSCVLIKADDSLDSIFASGEMMAKYASKRAGIGFEVGRIRPIGSPIRGGSLAHTGMIPFLKKWYSDLRSCCVRPDTWVQVLSDTSTQTIQVKDLLPGMKIKTLDENLAVVFKTVTHKWNTHVSVKDQVRLVFENQQTLNCSLNHPIMVNDADNQPAQRLPLELKASDQVITDMGTTNLQVLELSQNNDPEYIDITVEGTHTFFAGSSESSPLVLTHNSQGGIRNASCTVFFPIFHYEFDSLIVLKNNQGTEETRVRHLDYGVVLSSYFWMRFRNQQNITFFDPNQVPDLYEAFYRNCDEFERLYEYYEANAESMNLRHRTVSAEEVFKNGIIRERTNTGRIYLVFIDNVQKQGPFNTQEHPIYQSNLCCLHRDAIVTFKLQSGQEESLTIHDAARMYRDNLLNGAQVLSYQDGQQRWAPVLGVFKTKTVRELVRVQTTTASLLCTADHRIFTHNRGYVQAADLDQSDQLCGADNSVESVVQVSHQQVDNEPVYDITVPSTQCFFANKILVHNCEILLPTVAFDRLEDSRGRISLCTLGSINWGAFRHPEDMRRACRLLHRSLNNILDYQDFLSIQSSRSNDEIRPLGIGVTNLAYWHAKRKLKYGEPNSLSEVKTWIEHQTFYLTEASVELARERGKCELSDSTWYGQGVFPWERRAAGVDSLTSFEPELNWETLRDDIKRWGVRNATLSAIAPVESSSLCINSTNGIEMPMNLISTKESKAGSIVQVVPEYSKLKKHYQIMWDQPDCLPYLKTAAVLAAYIDQSISTNTFYSAKHFPDKKIPVTLVAKNLMLAQYYGLKTLYYSLIEKQASAPSKESATPEYNVYDDDDCEACKL